MAAMATTEAPRLDPRKFRDPFVTAAGERRAQVALRTLDTLWFNTGTLCNLTCANCYIESSPRNDRLAYLEMADVVAYLDQIESLKLPTSEIGFTGGEPFMNPAIIDLLTAQTALANARAQQVQSRWQWYTSLAQLARDAGVLGARGDTPFSFSPDSVVTSSTPNSNRP